MVTWRSVSAVVFLSLCALGASAGDTIYGRIVEVRSPDVLVIASGPARYVVHLVAIVCTRNPTLVPRARQLVTNLALGKGARVRIEGFSDPVTMNGRIFIDDPKSIVRDLGTQIVLAGFARALTSTAYKYRELDLAERAAMAARRGIYGENACGNQSYISCARNYCPNGARRQYGVGTGHFAN